MLLSKMKMRGKMDVNKRGYMRKTKVTKISNGGGSLVSNGCDKASETLGEYLATKPIIRTFLPLLIMVGLCALAFVVLAAARTHAETATASVTVPVSCTLTATPADGHTTTVNGGTYDEAAAETILGAACNDNGGYSVYAIGYSGDASGNSNSTSMIGPSVSGTPLTIPSCAGDNCTSTTPDSSRWAMKLTAVSGASTPSILNGYGSFSAIPSEYAHVITYPALTATDNRSETKATYAVSIASTQPAGTYTGKVKYTIVHPDYANADGTITKGITFLTTNGSTITINGNTYANGASATIDAGTYTISGNYAEGFEFDSWSVDGGTLGSTTTDPTTVSFTGPVTLTLNSKSSCASSLSGSMQDFDPSKLCDGVNSGSLTDSRGADRTYTVAKLADGKWWMTSNLNLPGGTTLYNTDTDITAASYSLPSSSASFSSDTAATVYNSNSTTCGNGSSCYSYYSYLAATAGTGSSVSTDGYNASGSICPKGWRLPTATTSNANAQSNNNWKTGDFYALATAYGANLESYYYQSSGTFYNNAGPGTTPNFLLSGYYNGSSFRYGGSYGYYWSATSYSSTSAYSLYFSSGLVNSADYGNRRYGFAVRCVYDGQ